MGSVSPGDDGLLGRGGPNLSIFTPWADIGNLPGGPGRDERRMPFSPAQP
jgi:hypothetical protein